MKTLWFRYTYIVFVLSSKFRPRVIPMLYSFYLIVYLICISYFIIIFPFLCVVVFCMWVIYRFFFYYCYNGYLCFFIFMFVFGDKDRDYIIIDIPLCVCFLGSMIISRIFILSYDDFYFYVLYGIIGFMW